MVTLCVGGCVWRAAGGYINVDCPCTFNRADIPLIFDVHNELLLQYLIS